MPKNFTPFDSIGLCFSGGGYRATFFSLGVVSYLNKVHYKDKPLLDNVEALSTVSGGTLLGAAYAKASTLPNFNFDAFYREFYAAFEAKNDRLLENAIGILGDDTRWTETHKKRSLINAFALAYADMDLYKDNFGIFEDNKKANLKHLCFNATDFSYGLAFRFQNTGMFGNKALNCTEVNKVKFKTQLADIVASSSCFPLGFEPLVYPDDYYKDQTDNDYLALKDLEKFKNGVGIMDGGITDNQGIGSMVNISKQKSRQRSLDLIIVNDVGSFKMDPWEPDAKSTESKATLQKTILKYLKYLRFREIYWIALLVGILLIVANALQWFAFSGTALWYIVGGVFSGIGFVLTILGAIISKWKNRGIRWFRKIFKQTVPDVLIDEVTSFQNLDIALIKRMLQERMSSAVKMVNDVFLKQIRRLNYDLIYASTDLQNKIITSTVYELNGQKTAYTRGFKVNEKIEPIPSEKLKAVALTASETPTTLWWDETDIAKDRMDTLIACGQFTTCYGLMDYILKLKKQDIKSDEMDALYTQLQKDWKAFNKKPLGMV